MKRAGLWAVLVLAALAAAWWWQDRAPGTGRADPVASGAEVTPDQTLASSQDEKPPGTQVVLTPAPSPPSEAGPAGTPSPRFGSREEYLQALLDSPSREPELEDIAAVRARIRAGDGAAAWTMLNHVRVCAQAELLDDAQVLARARARAADRPVPSDETGRAIEDVTRKQHEQSDLAQMRELRHHCPQLQPEDNERLLDWLEVALAAGHEDFLYSLSIPGGLPLPREQAWRVRHAERLADLIVRARQAYQARLAAGDRRLLERGRFFYSNEHLWSEIDPYPVYLHALVNIGLVWPITDNDFRWRDVERYGGMLDPDQRTRAMTEAGQILQRCCGVELPSF